MIEPHLLEALVAFKEYGTLSRAAEELHISQPALSRSMQKLEDTLQVTLFERTKNHLKLTDTGLMAAEYAERIVKEQRDMVINIRNYDRSLHTLSIGYCAPGPMYLIPNIASNYAPGMSISSNMETEENLLKGLRNGNYQIVVLSYFPKEKGYYSKALLQETLYASVVPANPISVYENTGIHFKDINGETFLMNRSVGVWDEITRRNMPDSKLLLQSDSESLREIVSTSSLSSFVTNLTNRIFGNEHRNGRISVPFLDDEATMQFYIVCLEENASKYKKFFAKLIADAS